jgi:hypothetical protein
MANQTAKNILALYDNTCKQMNDNFVFASQMETDTQSGVVLQNANNVYWRSVEQQAPVISGFDLSGVTPGNIIQQTYPLNVEAPRNDYFSMDAAELRDKTFMENRSRAAARKLNADANQRASNLVTSTGSLYYESSTAGFDFLAEANTIMRERQAYTDMGTSFFLTPRDSQIMSSDLASRTLFPNNRSEEAYAKAMIGERVAGFDRVFEASTFGNIAAAAGGTTTVASDVVEIPQSFITVGGSIQNVDYRFGVINLTNAATFAVGDVITFPTVNALGLMDKTNTGSLMTFKVIAKDTNALTVYPKPIAANQAGITTSQAAYANISTAIVSGMTASKVNVAGGRANSFWANDSVCFVNADGNLDVLNEFDGMKVDSQTLDNGVKLYIAYDAKLDSLNCRVRLFTWYGLVNKDPSRNGNAVYVPV